MALKNLLVLFTQLIYYSPSCPKMTSVAYSGKCPLPKLIGWLINCGTGNSTHDASLLNGGKEIKHLGILLSWCSELFSNKHLSLLFSWCFELLIYFGIQVIYLFNSFYWAIHFSLFPSLPSLSCFILSHDPHAPNILRGSWGKKKKINRFY